LPPLKLRPVRRIRDPYSETVERSARYGDPIVITGTLAWPAVGQWTPRVLREQAGEVQAHAQFAGTDTVRPDARSERRSLAECAEVLRDEGSRFLARAPVQSFPRELRDQLGVPRFCVDARGLRADVCLGAPETISQLHFDVLHTLVAQVHGRTRFLIYPPNERSNLYPFPISTAAARVSRVDVARPDLVAFPRVSAARGFHCDLREGELLLIPAGAWQSARVLATSISVQFRWPSPAMVPAVMAWDAWKRIRGG
jgi:hypothetical protein